MLWKFLQIAIFLAVTFTGIYYEWTPNGYVLSLLAVGAAFFTTLLLSWAFDTSRVLLVKQREKHSLPRGR